MTRNRQPSPLEPILLAHMEAVRIQLLRLHKVLLDDERKSYEFLNGPMGPPGKVLSLVMTDPFFDWLHAISRLMQPRSKDLASSAAHAISFWQKTSSQSFR
jgi:hypothetical protein